MPPQLGQGGFDAFTFMGPIMASDTSSIFLMTPQTHHHHQSRNQALPDRYTAPVRHSCGTYFPSSSAADNGQSSSCPSSSGCQPHSTHVGLFSQPSSSHSNSNSTGMLFFMTKALLPSSPKLLRSAGKIANAREYRTDSHFRRDLFHTHTTKDRALAHNHPSVVFWSVARHRFVFPRSCWHLGDKPRIRQPFADDGIHERIEALVQVGLLA